MKNYSMITRCLLAAQLIWALPQLANAHTQTTKVRCWARTQQQHQNPQTYWKWAKNQDGSNYQLQGHWQSSIDPISLFFTDTPQSEIKARCQSTLNLSPNDDVLWYAANTDESYNQIIWSDEPAPLDDTITKIISFGDSISDTGNLFNRFQWKFPNKNAWFLGHFSNGLVWTEYLAQDQSVPLYTLAQGGAAGTEKYHIITGLDEQVTDFLTSMKHTKNPSLKNDLFLIEIGLNDFVNYDRNVDDVNHDLELALAKLVAQGAKNFIILRLPDVSIAPKFNYINPEKTQRIRQKIAAFNTNLEEISHLYNIKGINMALYYTDILFSKLHAYPQNYGLKNVTQACLDIHRDNAEDFLLNHNLTPSCQSLGPDHYMFWGVTHPTTQVHKLIAQAIEHSALKRFHFKNPPQGATDPSPGTPE